MATNVTLNGTTYAIPGLSETGWADEVSSYLIALSSGTLQKAGGAFTLTAEVDFGATYGVKSPYFTSRGTAAAAGILRLANAENISWRNAANSADLSLTTNSSDLPEFDGNEIATHETVTKTEYGYLSGVTSAIQTQLTTNAGNIATNTSDIATNTSDISTNTADIATNTSDISTLDSAAAKTADNETITGAWDFDNPLTMAHNSTPANPAASHNKLYFKNDEKLYKLDSAGNEIEVGSGTGSGEINYIDNGEFESNTDGWATYDNGASATPTDGTTGTSSNLTISAQDSTVLRGAKSLKIAKGAADAQGEGVSYDFSIKGQDVSKKLKIQFDFKTNEDAAYAAGDLTVYIYDVTNATLITPVDTDIISGQNIFQTSFNSTTSTSYRLIFHVATTNASAYDLYLDNVIVGPGMTSQGAAIEGQKEYTPTISDFANFTGLTINPVSRILYNRVGDKLFFDFFLRVAGTGTDAAGFDFDLAGFLSGLGITQANNIYVPFTLYGTGTTGGRSGNAFIQGSDIDFYQYDVSGDTTQILGNDLGSGANKVRDIGFQCLIPIVEYAGKGIVPMLAEDNLSEWQDYSSQISAPANSTVTCSYRRVGQEIEIYWNQLASGASTALNPVLPANLTIDTSLIGTTNQRAMGFGTYFDIGNAFYELIAKYSNTTSFELRYDNGTSLSGVPALANDDELNLVIKAPILEWAGSQNSLVGYSEASSSNLGLVKKNKWQRRTLATSATGASLNTTLTELSLANLEIGKTYEVNLMAHLVLATPNAATEQVRVTIQHDGASLGGVLLIGDQATIDQLQMSASAVAIFTATATTVTFLAVSSSSDATTGVYADATIPTYVEIKELNNYGEATTDFTP